MSNQTGPLGTKSVAFWTVIGSLAGVGSLLLAIFVLVKPPPAVSGPAGYKDALTAPGRWRTITDPLHGASCGFAEGLLVKKKTAGPYRCLGPKTEYDGSFDLSVTVALREPGSCAGVWFRFRERSGQPAGYLLRVCEEGLRFLTHGVADVHAMSLLTSWAHDLPLNERHRIRIVATGQKYVFSVDGDQVGTESDATFTDGRFVLGIVSPADGGSVLFRDVAVG